LKERCRFGTGIKGEGRKFWKIVLSEKKRGNSKAEDIIRVSDKL
jgi:hypothetical protein